MIGRRTYIAVTLLVSGILLLIGIPSVSAASFLESWGQGVAFILPGPWYQAGNIAAHALDATILFMIVFGVVLEAGKKARLPTMTRIGLGILLWLPGVLYLQSKNQILLNNVWLYVMLVILSTIVVFSLWYRGAGGLLRVHGKGWAAISLLATLFIIGGAFGPMGDFVVPSNPTEEIVKEKVAGGLTSAQNCAGSAALLGIMLFAIPGMRGSGNSNLSNSGDGGLGGLGAGNIMSWTGKKFRQRGENARLEKQTIDAVNTFYHEALPILDKEYKTFDSVHAMMDAILSWLLRFEQQVNGLEQYKAQHGQLPTNIVQTAHQYGEQFRARFSDLAKRMEREVRYIPNQRHIETLDIYSTLNHTQDMKEMHILATGMQERFSKLKAAINTFISQLKAATTGKLTAALKDNTSSLRQVLSSVIQDISTSGEKVRALQNLDQEEKSEIEQLSSEATSVQKELEALAKEDISYAKRFAQKFVQIGEHAANSITRLSLQDIESVRSQVKQLQNELHVQQEHVEERKDILEKLSKQLPDIQKKEEILGKLELETFQDLRFLSERFDVYQGIYVSLSQQLQAEGSGNQQLWAQTRKKTKAFLQTQVQDPHAQNLLSQLAAEMQRMPDILPQLNKEEIGDIAA